MVSLWNSVKLTWFVLDRNKTEARVQSKAGSVTCIVFQEGRGLYLNDIGGMYRSPGVDSLIFRAHSAIFQPACTRIRGQGGFRWFLHRGGHTD